MLASLVCNPLQAQDYDRVDASILLYPDRFDSVEQLSRLIERDFTSEDEKVRAIYSWIIQNIAYDPEEYKRFDFNFKNYRERNLKEEKTREKVIERTLRQGVAVCEGYAMLFERLCELSNIQNYLVRGNTKSNFDDIGKPVKSLHMWNVAIIGSRPYLFDPTWGAGKYRDRFVKEPTYFYYKIDPNLLIRTHYPQLVDDSFVEHPISREEFQNLPIIVHPELFIDEVISPKNGVLSTASDSGVVTFQLKLDAPSQLEYSFGQERSAITFETNEELLEFEVPIELGKKVLIIYIDDQPALGYKLK